MVGDTGIYELNLEGIGRINAIQFNKDDLDDMYKLIIDNNGNVVTNNGDAMWDAADKILIDIVYEGA